MELLSKKIINLIGAISCLGLILFALYSEHILLLEPCPLCVLQRIAVIALGIIFLIAFIHSPNKITSRIYVFLCIMISSFGTATAAWHVHLQNLPADEIPSCGPGLGYMIENLPLALQLQQREVKLSNWARQLQQKEQILRAMEEATPQ